MSVFKRLFVWWQDATPGTYFTTWFSGNLVGEDQFKNCYYRSCDDKRRWVIYAGTVEASRVPPEWHGWMHHTFANPPTVEALKTKAWEMGHQPNLTGQAAPIILMGAFGKTAKDRPPLAITKPGGPIDTLVLTPSFAGSRAMQNSVVETLIGAAVIAVAVLFFLFAYSSTGSAPISGYDVLANFNRADGVNVGTDVRMSGIKIGTVSKLSLDPKTYNAVVTLSLDNAVKLPDDFSVRITSDGLLGNQYLSIEPGSSQQAIKAGGEIENTQGSIDLMGLLGKVMFGGGSATGAAAGGSK